MCPYETRNTPGNERANEEITENVKSWFDCSELCREREGCKYWTWINEKHGSKALKCRTMTDGVIELSNSYNTLVSGARDCMGAHNKIGIKVPVTAMQGYTEGQYAFAVAIQVVIGQSVSLYNCIVYI